MPWILMNYWNQAIAVKRMVEAGVALELHLIDVELGKAEGCYLAFRWFFRHNLARIITER